MRLLHRLLPAALLIVAALATPGAADPLICVDLPPSTLELPPPIGDVTTPHIYQCFL